MKAVAKKTDVEILTDSMTAPVEGSWGLPAWTARVPNLCKGEGALGGVSIEVLSAAGDILLYGF